MKYTFAIALSLMSFSSVYGMMSRHIQVRKDTRQKQTHRNFCSKVEQKTMLKNGLFPFYDSFLSVKYKIVCNPLSNTYFEQKTSGSSVTYSYLSQSKDQTPNSSFTKVNHPSKNFIDLSKSLNQRFREIMFTDAAMFLQQLGEARFGNGFSRDNMTAYVESMPIEIQTHYKQLLIDLAHKKLKVWNASIKVDTAFADVDIIEKGGHNSLFIIKGIRTDICLDTSWKW